MWLFFLTSTCYALIKWFPQAFYLKKHLLRANSNVTSSVMPFLIAIIVLFYTLYHPIIAVNVYNNYFSICLSLSKKVLVGCNGLNVCVVSKFLCWNPNPQCDGIRRWVILGKWLGHEGGALINGAPVSSLTFSHHVRMKEDSNPTRKRTLTDTNPAGILILDFQPPELREINFCLFISQPVYGTLL